MYKEIKKTFSLNVDYVDVIQEDDTVCVVEMDILHLGVNRNLSKITKESVEKSINTIFNKPILAIYNTEVKGCSSDFKSHARNQAEQEKTQCVGLIPMREFSQPTWHMSEDGLERLRVKGILWKFYNPELVRILKDKDGTSKISIELGVVDGFENEEGIFEFKQFMYLGCMILGDDIECGMIGSNLKVTKFEYDEMLNKTNEYLLKYSTNNSKIFEKIKEYKKENESSYNSELYNEFSKDEIGTEPALKVDKSKEALSNSSWGEVDKSILKTRVIKAKNFKTIAKDVFLQLEDGWEDGKETALKYPVMEIKKGTLCYNRGALASAKGYAEKNNETEVLSKLKSIYKSLEISFEENKEVGKVTMEAENKDLKMSEDIKPEEIKTEEQTADAMMACGGKTYDEEEKTKKEVDDEDDSERDQTRDEEDDLESDDKKYEDEKDKKDDKENKDEDVAKMSADENVDAAANAEMLEKSAENNKELAEEGNPSLKKIDLEEALEKIKLLEKETDELRKFKAETEEKEKVFRVAKLMEEISEKVPKEAKEELLEKSKSFSLENLGSWENMVKATAFEYAVNKPKKDPYIRMSIWDNQKENKKSSSLWGNI